MTPFRKYVSGVVPLTAAAIEKLNMQKGQVQVVAPKPAAFPLDDDLVARCAECFRYRPEALPAYQQVVGIVR
jgi:hypothetical protein